MCGRNTDVTDWNYASSTDEDVGDDEMSQNRHFRIMQNGVAVASSEGPERVARGTTMLYAAQYEEDGPIEIQEKVSKRWKTIYKTPQETL